MTSAPHRLLPGVALLLLASAAASQTLPEGHGAMPPGEGTIRGRVVHEADGRALPEEDVVLYTLRADGMPGLAAAVTDAEGRFVFENLSTNPELVYLVGARSGEVPFGRRVAFAGGEKEIAVDLRVAETSRDTSAVRLGTSFLRFDRACEGVRVNEAHEISNPTSRVVFVPEDARQQSVPVFEAELPEGAEGFVTPFGDGSLGLEVEGSRLRYWGPVYPGEQELEFGYSLPARPEQHERVFPAGAARVVFLSSPGGAEIRADGLVAAEDRSIDGRDYRALAASDVEPGGRLAFSVTTPPAPEASPIAFERSELWLEIDDAALTVDENHLLSVEGDAPLEPDSDAPLLCLPLPPGAEGLRFSSQTLAMGIEPDTSGAVAFRGPIPAGQSVVALRYSLPVTPADSGPRDGLPFERRFSRRLPLLSVFVADTGVVPETTRLHRRRSVSRADRRYLQLEGFEIEPDEEVAIRLRRLEAPRPLSRLAGAGFALLAAGAAAAFLIGPLRGGGRKQESEDRRPGELGAERDAVYATIRDLDDDFETGKLTAEDHEQLRRDLKARAVRLMEQERRAAERPPPSAGPGPAERAAAFCIHCGTKLPERARFCPQCGERTVAGAAG